MEGEMNQSLIVWRILTLLRRSISTSSNSVWYRYSRKNMIVNRLSFFWLSRMRNSVVWQIMFFVLFIGVISSFSLSSNSMNLLKGALFSSSNRRKSKRSQQHSSTNYTFLQANNSLIDRSVYHFENNDMELGLMDSEDESNQNEPRPRPVRQNFLSSAHTGGSLVIVEKPVLPNETIQAFAIRYRVPVSLIDLMTSVIFFSSRSLNWNVSIIFRTIKNSMPFPRVVFQYVVLVYLMNRLLQLLLISMNNQQSHYL